MALTWMHVMKAKSLFNFVFFLSLSLTDPVRLVSGRPIGLSSFSVRPGEDVWLRHQILLSVQELPHVVPLLLQQHPEELAVHRAGEAHLLVVLRGGSATNMKSAVSPVFRASCQQREACSSSLPLLMQPLLVPLHVCVCV